MKNKKFNKRLLSGFLFACLLLTSCEVHEWPELPGEYATLSLQLDYFTDMHYWHQAYEGASSTTTVSKNPNDYYDNLRNIKQGARLAVTVKVHRNNSSRMLVSTDTFLTEMTGDFNSTVDIKVPVGEEYTVTVWSQLVEDNDAAFYDNSDFNSIKLIKEKYVGNTDMRDAFRGRISISIPTETSITEVVQMRRPMGKLEFVTTGLKNFLANEEVRLKLAGQTVSLDDYTVVISYPAYYPSAYNAMDDRLENSSTGYSFSAPLTRNGDSDDETSLGFDYVMINNSSDEAVQARVSIVHKDGTQVAGTGMITIPMGRDYHTVVRGNFLTTKGDGGIGLDPDFEGDFNITL